MERKLAENGKGEGESGWGCTCGCGWEREGEGGAGRADFRMDFLGVVMVLVVGTLRIVRGEAGVALERVGVAI